jgi:hypothetical protein
MFEIIYRPEFEWHLRGRLEHNHQNDDPAWYALRNAIYATGCRLYHSSNNTASFSNIHGEAWTYFSNALSVHSELLLRSPSIRAVRALLAMVSTCVRDILSADPSHQSLFAEGLGSPALGSGLIANAMLLCQSLGMHRKVPLPESALDSEKLQRIWLFWAVYCCEKNIARRIGRSSVSIANCLIQNICLASTYMIITGHRRRRHRLRGSHNRSSRKSDRCWSDEVHH